MSDFFTHVKKSLFDIGAKNTEKSTDTVNKIEEEKDSENSMDINENDDFIGANVIETFQSEKKIGKI